MADPPNYPKPVWFDKQAITNVISFANLADHFFVECNNRKEDTFFVYKHNGEISKFPRSKCGLCFHDLINRQKCFIQMVKENEIGHSKRQLLSAEEARKSHNKTAFPSVNDHKKAVKCNLMKNCPVATEDTNTCEKVHGESMTALKGKTMRTAPLEVKTDATPVPTKLLQLHQEVALEGDTHFINNQPFITTISRKTHLETVDHLVDRKADALVASLTDVINCTW